MSIRDMRNGDTIIGKDMTSTYTVEEKLDDRVRARSDDPPKRLKTFYDDELFCVDFDDGLWQQTDEREG